MTLASEAGCSSTQALPKPVGGREGDTFVTTFDYDAANNWAVVAGYSQSMEVVNGLGFAGEYEVTFIQIYNPSHIEVSGQDNTLREYAMTTRDVSRIQAIKWRQPT